MAHPVTFSLDQTSLSDAEQLGDQWTPETRFGKWFLSTGVWYRFVLDAAINDLHRLAGDRFPEQAKILDAGCGQGASFTLLAKYFKPESIAAIDIDPGLVEIAKINGNACRCEVNVQHGSIKQLDFPDNTFDVVFCHQLIHHITFRAEALQEIYRVLRPGGLLLLSESCKHFLHVYWVAGLFRHPKIVHKTAEGYVELIKDANFSLLESDILKTTPWWSKRDFGLLEKTGLQSEPPTVTEISVVATKPE